MNIKYFFYLASCCALLTSIFSVNTAFAANNSNLGPGMMPMPTPEEMEEIERFIASLSPEEVAELEKLGQELLDEAERTGVPLFQEPALAQQPPAAKPTAAPAKKEEVKAKPSAILAKDMRKNLQSMLDGIVQHLHSMRKKI